MKRASFTAGLVLCFCGVFCWLFPVLPLIFASVAILLSAVFLILFRRTDRILFRDLLFASVCLFASAIFFFFPVTDFYDTADTYDQQQLTLTATLTEDPVLVSSGIYRYVARPVSGPFSQKFLFFSPVYYTEAGGTVTGTFSFERPSESYFLSNLADGVALEATLETDSEIVTVSDPEFSFYFLSGKVRRFVRANLVRYVSDPEAGFMTAVLTGNKQALAGEDYRALSETGMLHIVAVSGLHVSIFVSFALFFLRKVSRPRLRFFLSILSLGAILLFSGFTPSVCRAVIMSSVLFLNDGFFLESDGLNRLGIAAILILFAAPYAVLSLSFELSFLAALGILLLSRPVERSLVHWLFVYRHVICGSVLRNLISLFSMSLASLCFTFPILLFRLNQLSLWSLILSPVILPVLQICFILTLILLLLCGIPYVLILCPLLGILIRYGVFFMSYVSSSAADLVGAVRGLPPAVLWVLVIAIAAVAVVLFLIPGIKSGSSREKKKKIRYGVSLLLLAAVLLSAYQVAVRVGEVSPGEGVLHTAFLDVGQGNCFVSLLDGEACVIDCGGTKDPGHVAADYLSTLGVDTVKFVLISHLHSDHANGLKDLCEEKEILEIIIPTTEGDADLYLEILELAEKEGATLTELDAGSDGERMLSSATLHLLTKHLDDTAEDQNENSIVGLMEYGDFRAMFTGDITKSAEERLIDAYGSSLKCDVLSVPHHGSKGSSSKDFMKITSPVYAVVSVGAGNSYKHPTKEALNRIDDVGAEIYRTDTMSTVVVLTDGSQMEVSVANES